MLRDRGLIIMLRENWSKPVETTVTSIVVLGITFTLENCLWILSIVLHKLAGSNCKRHSCHLFTLRELTILRFRAIWNSISSVLSIMLF